MKRSFSNDNHSSLSGPVNQQISALYFFQKFAEQNEFHFYFANIESFCPSNRPLKVLAQKKQTLRTKMQNITNLSRDNPS